MAFLLTSLSANISFRTMLHAVAIVSSEFPISWGPDERRLVSWGNTCFATGKGGKKLSISLMWNYVKLMYLQTKQTTDWAVHPLSIAHCFLPMVVWKLLVRDRLLSRNIAVFWRVWLGDFSRLDMRNRDFNLSTKTWLTALEPWNTIQRKEHIWAVCQTFARVMHFNITHAVWEEILFCKRN